MRLERNAEMNAEFAEGSRQGTQRETKKQGLAKGKTKPVFTPSYWLPLRSFSSPLRTLRLSLRYASTAERRGKHQIRCHRRVRSGPRSWLTVGMKTAIEICSGGRFGFCVALVSSRLHAETNEEIAKKFRKATLRKMGNREARLGCCVLIESDSGRRCCLVVC